VPPPATDVLHEEVDDPGRRSHELNTVVVVADDNDFVFRTILRNVRAHDSDDVVRLCSVHPDDPSLVVPQVVGYGDAVHKVEYVAVEIAVLRSALFVIREVCPAPNRVPAAVLGENDVGVLYIEFCFHALDTGIKHG
jgi:hypothetical protein